MPEISGPVVQLNEAIRGISTAILTTQRPDGSLHSCPMAAHLADDAGALWFLSHNSTEKVEAVRTQPQVNVAFADHAAQRYVSVSGYCELVRDHDLARQLWDPSYSSWFPAGVDDANLVLMKVAVQRAECWDAAKGRMVTVTGFAQNF